MWCLLSSSSWQVGSLTFRQHTQFAMQGLKIAIQQQCTSGFTRGGVWPLKSQNITNPRRTSWHRPSLAPIVNRKGTNFHRNLTVPAASARQQTRACAAAYVRVGGIGTAALWQIVRWTRLDVTAVIFSLFSFQDPRRRAGFLRGWQLDRRAPASEASLHGSASLWGESAQHLFSPRLSASCGIFICYCSWPGAVLLHSSQWGCSMLWLRESARRCLFFGCSMQQKHDMVRKAHQCGVYVLFMNPAAKMGASKQTV